MIFNLPKGIGTGAFKAPFSCLKIKDPEMADSQYSEWLEQFDYIGNEHMIIAIRPSGSFVEFHATFNPTSSVKKHIKSFKEFLAIMKDCDLLTLVSDRDSKLKELLRKRFSFNVEKQVGFLRDEGVSYRRFMLVRDKESA